MPESACIDWLDPSRGESGTFLENYIPIVLRSYYAYNEDSSTGKTTSFAAYTLQFILFIFILFLVCFQLFRGNKILPSSR